MKTVGQKGFTIVELLIVVVVIAILAAITIVSYNGITTRATFSKIQQDISTMQKLVESYYAQNGVYPTTSSWIHANTSPDGFIPSVVPTLTNSLPRYTAGPSSPNTTYSYRSTANGSDYKIIRLHQPSIPAAEQALVPDSMKDGTWASNRDRYGVWSPGGYSL